MARVIFLLALIVFNLFNITFANDDISEVIDLYKSAKYQECVTKAEIVTKNDPTSALAYYYIALANAQMGKRDLAIKNYDKVIALGTNKALVNYAKTGKAKLAIKEKTKAVTGAESMLEDVDENANPEQTSQTNIQATDKTNVVKTDVVKQEPQKAEVQKTPEKAVAQKTVPQKSNQSNKADTPPTNDEIVNAIRVLQKAGLLQGGLPMGNAPQQQYAQNSQNQQYPQNPQAYMDPRTQEMQAMLMMMNSNNNNGYGNSGNDMMNLLPYMQNGGKMSPQMIQMMMMKNMMPDFSSGNNNGY